MPLVEQKLPTLPEHLPVFSGVLVTRSLVLCVCFVDHCLSFCNFSFGHCVVCPSSIYGLWLPLWHLQTLLIYTTPSKIKSENGYIFVWKLTQTLLELDLWADKFLFFPRRDLNSHHWCTAAPIARPYVQHPRPLDHIRYMYIYTWPPILSA